MRRDSFICKLHLLKRADNFRILQPLHCKRQIAVGKLHIEILPCDIIFTVPDKSNFLPIRKSRAFLQISIDMLQQHFAECLTVQKCIFRICPLIVDFPRVIAAEFLPVEIV